MLKKRALLRSKHIENLIREFDEVVESYQKLGLEVEFQMSTTNFEGAVFITILVVGREVQK